MAYTTIDDPSVYFQTTLYTGDGASSNAITNGGNSDLQPDWLWIKNRSSSGGTGPNIVFDSTRGATKDLHTNNNEAEHTNSNTCKSFNTDGFTVGDSGAVNNNTDNFVAWQWKANGGTVANDTNGDITTSVQASQTAGFSIATYTGNGGSGQTLGHGLGAEADLIIFKDRESASAWRTYVRLLGASKFLNLNTTDAASASTNIFPSASSTTIGVEQNDVMNKNNSDFVMYSFRSIQGYSKIGSYTGNGNATDGPFVYLGFKPAWLFYRNVSRSENWLIEDNKRNPFNRVAGAKLQANVNDAETTETRWGFDFLSNGFKVRQTEAQNANNGSDETIIYMAFAESPFVSSEGVPTTAR